MTDSLSRDVYWTIRSVSRILKDRLCKRLEDSGITWPQFHALCHIDENGIRANELAKELQCNASNMTGIIDRMIENHWVYREHSAKDRRVWLIKLTEEGSKLKAKLLPQHYNNIETLMAVLSEPELVTLKNLLEKLIHADLEEEKQ